MNEQIFDIGRDTMSKIRKFIGLSGFFFAKLSDKSIHGDYIGISPAGVMQGYAFNKCIVAFSVDNNGFKLVSNIRNDSELERFTIIFPASWVFRLRNWNVDHCLSIRQHAESKLAQLVFDFTKNKHGNITVDADLFLGEGMPLHMGAFFRAERINKDRTLLEELYNYYRMEADLKSDEFIEENSQSSDNDDLIALDLDDARKIMSGHDVASKVEILKKAGHNLWTGSESEIAKRLEIIELGLNSNEYSAQEEALKIFTLGGRVTGAVNMAVSFLSDQVSATRRNNDTSPSCHKIISKAVESVTCLLYEAVNYCQLTAEIEDKFKTLDLKVIRYITQGNISPELFESLEKISTIKPSSRFSLDDCRRLRGALRLTIMFLDDREDYKNIVDECERTLSAYII